MPEQEGEGRYEARARKKTTTTKVTRQVRCVGEKGMRKFRRPTDLLNAGNIPTNVENPCAFTAPSPFDVIFLAPKLKTRTSQLIYIYIQIYMYTRYSRIPPEDLRPIIHQIFRPKTYTENNGNSHISGDFFFSKRCFYGHFC